MKLEQILEKSNISKESIYYNEPMSKHTSFKIGGTAECYIRVDSLENLQEILKLSNENNIPLTIIGNGTNILVKDEGIKGIVAKINIKSIEIYKNNVATSVGAESTEAETSNKSVTAKAGAESTMEEAVQSTVTQVGAESTEAETSNESVTAKVGAGSTMAEVAQALCKNGLTGFEELSGIPGTIGGAIRMNAGAHGKEIKDVVINVTAIDYKGNIKKFSNEEMQFEYRNSIFSKEKYIIIGAELKLSKGNKQEIEEKMKQYMTWRKEHQPLEYPNAGSTFKRGADFVTAQLIDECGLKGYTIGGAQISTKHAGFIINKENAKAQDVLKLVEHTKKEVLKKFGKQIELEIEVIGD